MPPGQLLDRGDVCPGVQEVGDDRGGHVLQQRRRTGARVSTSPPRRHLSRTRPDVSALAERLGAFGGSLD
jgi:hypothetical protein